MRKLSVAFGDYPHAQALLDGDASIAGYGVQPVEVRPIIGAYRRMIRDLEFDICELAPTSYVMARSEGIPLTAIPIFLNRRFEHSNVQCSAASGIRVPKDLEGKRIGVRAYTVTTAVWVRGLLATEYGVDVDKITWVTDDEDHIEGHAPDNVTRVTDNRSLGELLKAGELDAAFTGNAGTGRAGKPQDGWTTAAAAEAAQPGETYPLFAEAEVLGTDYYQRTGIYPLHSVVSLRSELVGQDPELPSALYAALVDSKRRQLKVDPDWSSQPKLAKSAGQVDGDPVPYGLTANRTSIEALVRYSQQQKVLPDGFGNDIDHLFAPGDYPDA